MTDPHTEAGFALAIEELENVSRAVNMPRSFDEIDDPIEFIQDTLYELNNIVATFESLQRIVEAQQFKVKVGDMFVMDCTIDSSPVVSFGTLGHVFDRGEARRIATIVTRYMKQTATLQPFERPFDNEEENV